MMLLLLATIDCKAYLDIEIPKGFSRSKIPARFRLASAAVPRAPSLMKRKLQVVAAIFQDDPAVSTVTWPVGFGTSWLSGGATSANPTIALKPRAERRNSAEEALARLTPKLARVAGVSS